MANGPTVAEASAGGAAPTGADAGGDVVPAKRKHGLAGRKQSVAEARARQVHDPKRISEAFVKFFGEFDDESFNVAAAFEAALESRIPHAACFVTLRLAMKHAMAKLCRACGIDPSRVMRAIDEAFETETSRETEDKRLAKIAAYREDLFEFAAWMARKRPGDHFLLSATSGPGRNGILVFSRYARASAAPRPVPPRPEGATPLPETVNYVDAYYVDLALKDASDAVMPRGPKVGRARAESGAPCVKKPRPLLVAGAPDAAAGAPSLVEALSSLAAPAASDDVLRALLSAEPRVAAVLTSARASGSATASARRSSRNPS